MQNFTIKAQEAIQDAHNLATEYEQQQVDGPHLMLTLVNQEEGVTLAILKKIGTDVERLKAKISGLIKKLPRVRTGAPGGLAEIYITPGLQRTILQAAKIAKNLTDEYVSTEHLFLALLQVPSSTQDSLKEEGLSYDKVLKVLADVRGS